MSPFNVARCSKQIARHHSCHKLYGQGRRRDVTVCVKCHVMNCSGYCSPMLTTKCNLEQDAANLLGYVVKTLLDELSTIIIRSWY